MRESLVRATWGLALEGCRVNENPETTLRFFESRLLQAIQAGVLHVSVHPALG